MNLRRLLSNDDAATISRVTARRAGDLSRRHARLPDVTREPALSTAIDWVADGYARFYSPQPDAFNPMYALPQTTEDLRQRIDASKQADITFALAAVILALLTAAPELEKSRPEYKRRVFDFVEHCRRNDLRVCEAISDAKGDRSLSPSRQADADMYVRVADRDSHGIVVRGLVRADAGAAARLAFFPAAMVGGANQEHFGPRDRHLAKTPL